MQNFSRWHNGVSGWWIASWNCSSFLRRILNDADNVFIVRRLSRRVCTRKDWLSDLCIYEIRLQPGNSRIGGKEMVQVFGVTSFGSHWCRFYYNYWPTSDRLLCLLVCEPDCTINGGPLVDGSIEYLSSLFSIEATWSRNSGHDVICQLF